jgi:UDP-N-acetylmuramoyl-L-alanyl-D-glutamate--2,6-diaminopimelate ligase
MVTTMRSTPRRAPDAMHTRDAAPRTLGELLLAAPGAAARLGPELAALPVADVTNDSTHVRPGSLFVAVHGTASDGHDFIDDAIRRGATAIVVETLPDSAPAVPVIRVPDARRAHADIAAAWYDHPATALRIVGINGTVGKTSVLGMLAAALDAAGIAAGTIGSLGIGVGGQLDPTGMTAPDALVLQRALAQIRASGARVAAMEVTSHALVQRRVHGLQYALGVFTNLVPFEHADFHRTFRSYVDAKSRFFEQLPAAAPLIYNADDRAVRGVVRGRDQRLISCGTARTACVRIEPEHVSLDGNAFHLHVRRPLPAFDGSPIEAVRLPLTLRLLGASNTINAALAASAALCLGAAPDDVAAALAAFPPPRRRMEILMREPFTVIDDTVGHPDSVSAVFGVVTQFGARRVHVLFGIRGSRGKRINRRLGESLAIWLDRIGPASLTITSSHDHADERNRVTPAERAAFVAPLRAAGIAFDEHDACAAAASAMLGRARPGDLVLLLGAQGMDAGADHVRAWLETRGGGNIRSADR